MARTRHGDERRELEQAIGVPPLGEPGESVRASDEEQPCLGLLRLKVRERVDGVGGAAPIDVDRRHLEVRVLSDGAPAHRETVLDGGMPVSVLEGLRGGGHQKHPVQVQGGAHLACRGQMAVVDGVERPSEDADAEVRHAQWREPTLRNE